MSESNGQPDNLELWNKCVTTPPEAKKDFNRPGGFRGTSIDPIYRVRKLTELFGPVGLGWRFVQESRWREDFGKSSVCFVEGHIEYSKDGERYRTTTYAGGTIAGEKNPDECYKMATTDAMGKCCVELGIGADVYMGGHHGDKYQVAEPETKTEPQKKTPDEHFAAGMAWLKANGKSAPVKTIVKAVDQMFGYGVPESDFKCFLVDAIRAARDRTGMSTKDDEAIKRCLERYREMIPESVLEELGKAKQETPF